MGRVNGVGVIGQHVRSYDGDPHTSDVGAARVEIVRPYEEIRIWADPDRCALGMDLTFRARTKAYGLRRGTMRAAHELDLGPEPHVPVGHLFGQLHLRRGHARTERLVGPARPLVGDTRSRAVPAVVVVPGAVAGRVLRCVALGAGQRRAGVHRRVLGADRRRRSGTSRRLPPRARVGGCRWPRRCGTASTARPWPGCAERRRSCWRAGHARRSRPKAASTGLTSRSTAAGSTRSWCSTDDGRRGTAIFEVTGSHHHRYFPDTTPPGPLPS